MNPSLRSLYLLIFTGLLLEPCWLSGKPRAVAVTCVELTIFEVGNLRQTSEYRVEKESDESEKRTQKADQHRQALLLLLQMIHAAATGVQEPRMPGVAADMLSLGRTETTGEDYLIRGPPASG